MVGISHQVAWLVTSKERLVQSTGTASYRVMSATHLKNIALATFDYENDKGTLPPGATMNKSGRLLHGWQALLLPYGIDQKLADKIDFARPWNDPANRAALSTTVNLYGDWAEKYGQLPPDGYAPSTFAGNVHVLGHLQGMRRQDIYGGGAQTILMGEVTGQLPAWGHPTNWRDPAEGLDGSPRCFGSPWQGVVQFIMVDGSVRVLDRNIDPSVLRALATPDAEGKPVSSD